MNHCPAPHLGNTTATSDIGPLKLAVESPKYSEIDLVLWHDSPDDTLVSEYLRQTLVCIEEQRFTGVRIIRFVDAAAPEWSMAKRKKTKKGCTTTRLEGK